MQATLNLCFPRRMMPFPGIRTVAPLHAAPSGVMRPQGSPLAQGLRCFCGLRPEDVTDARLSAIVEYELIPLLREYWFDEPAKVREWSDGLRRAIR